MCQVTGQWSVREDLLVLYLDEEIPRYEPYRFIALTAKFTHLSRCLRLMANA